MFSRYLFLIGVKSTLLGLALALSGCQIVGLAATAIPPAPVAASYPGLAHQTVGIMVWADRGVVIDHPSIQADLARGLQDKLQQAAGADVKEVQKVQWYSTENILRFQEDHPEAESDAADQVALKFPVTRLVYVELVGLSLHPSEAIDLARGSAAANVRVIEINGKNTTTAYQEVNVSVVYPPKSPEEGVTGLPEEEVYRQTVDAMTSELAKRFISHEADAE